MYHTDESVQCSASQPPSLLSDIFQSRDWFVLGDSGCNEVETRPRSPLSSVSTFFPANAPQPETTPNLSHRASRSSSIWSKSSKLFSVCSYKQYDISFCCKHPVCIIQSNIPTSDLLLFFKTSFKWALQTPHYMPQQENLWLHQLLMTSHNKYLQIAQHSGNDWMLYCSLSQRLLHQSPCFMLLSYLHSFNEVNTAGYWTSCKTPLQVY